MSRCATPSNSARRQLEDYVRVMRGDVKAHAKVVQAKAAPAE